MEPCNHKQFTIYSHTYKICVNPAHCNYQAHDHVTNKFTCNKCQAVLTQNINGEQIEIEDWVAPENNRPF